MIGTSIAQYRVVAKLGAGGIGEVYRAHDENLDRDVAIKVLRAGLLTDEAARRGFRKEALALAKLNHPNVATVHDFTGQQGFDFLVIEYVPGETLSDRLKQGPLPEKETVRLGQQLAAGLAAAHEQGVVHRDLKPGNVRVTPEGRLKILDFGIAKLVQPFSETALTESLAEAQPAAGTLPYMAPEQLSGERPDHRVDIWGAGTVLYEMATGRRPYGATLATALAADIQHQPARPPSQLNPKCSSWLEEIILKCLEKDPENRYQSAKELAVDLRRLALRGPAPAPDSTPTASAQETPRRTARLARPRLLAVVGLIVFTGAAFAARGLLTLRMAGPAEPVRMTTTLPWGVRVTRGPGFASSLALSPDGRRLIIAGTSEDGQQLYERRFDQLEATPIGGTEGGSSPFFSPDGTWIGLFAEGRLLRVPAGGGAAVDITGVPEHPEGASWGSDDRIAFVSGARSPVYVVSARGGNAEPLTTLRTGELGHHHPEILPGGHVLLFDSNGWCHALDLRSGRRAALIQGTAPRYTANGHVIVSRGTVLLAAPFDPARLELTGPVVPVVERVASEHGGVRHYAISRSGTLAYVPGVGLNELLLRDAKRGERFVTERQLSFENPQFSPDGQRLAVSTKRGMSETEDIWIHDIHSGAASRLTFDGGRAPVWTPDGTTVTFSHLGERQGIYSKPADGRGEAVQLLPVDEFHWLIGWTPDGRTLGFGVMEGVTEAGTSYSSLMAFTNGESRRVVGPGSVWGGRLSPDGRWLAYYSLVAGHFEVYVTPFPEGGTRWLISDEGGRDPSWGPSGTEVYYRSDDRLMATRLDVTAGVRVLSRRLVVKPFLPPRFDDYDIHPDGRTLVLVRSVDDPRPGDIIMVLDWFTELRRLMGR